MSLMLPSVVMTSPMVECSVITFCVPISAAMLNGMGSSNHGVRTMRGCSSSMYPRALGTMKPTQSMSRTLNSAAVVHFYGDGLFRDKLRLGRHDGAARGGLRQLVDGTVARGLIFDVRA